MNESTERKAKKDFDTIPQQITGAFKSFDEVDCIADV